MTEFLQEYGKIIVAVLVVLAFRREGRNEHRRF